MLRKSTAALFASLLCLAPLGAQAQNQPGSTVKATHGSWEIRCSNAKPDACMMSQVGKGAEGNALLAVSVQKTTGAKTPNGEPIAAVLQIEAPLGVFLPAGVEVTIDGTQIGRAGFTICNAQGCFVSEPVAEDFVNKMKNGSSAVMAVTGPNGEKASVNISLSGFTKAYNAL